MMPTEPNRGAARSAPAPAPTATMPADAGQSPFHTFALDVETPLRSVHAKVAAVHFLLSPAGDPGEEVMDAIGLLVVEAYSSLDTLLAMHSQAIAAGARAGR